MAQPNWTDILTAFSALGIGMLGVYFAWRQHQMARLQWKHSLYDRRMAIYTSAGQYLSHIFAEGSLSDQALHDFIQATRESDFLLNEEVTAHLEHMYRQGLKLRTYGRSLSHLEVGPERTKIAEAEGELLGWFEAQGSELKRLFSPFLTLA